MLNKQDTKWLEQWKEDGLKELAKKKRKVTKAQQAQFDAIMNGDK